MNRTLFTPWKPTKAQLLAAHNKLVPDLAAKNLIVLFAGINPGLYTAAIGRHFGRPGNRFWPALHGGGFTPRLFSPFEESVLLESRGWRRAGCGCMHGPKHGNPENSA
jgi:double-stranded uracil-DNA glycosylase